MQEVLGAAGAATMCGYLVSMAKYAKPNITAAQVIAVALLSGEMSALLVSLISKSLHMTSDSIATVIATGIGAAVLASGVQQIGKKADAQREPPPAPAE